MAFTGKRLLQNQDQSDTTADRQAQASFKNTRSAKTLGRLSPTDLIGQDLIFRAPAEIYCQCRKYPIEGYKTLNRSLERRRHLPAGTAIIFTKGEILHSYLN